jgi:hypothetical protein
MVRLLPRRDALTTRTAAGVVVALGLALGIAAVGPALVTDSGASQGATVVENVTGGSTVTVTYTTRANGTEQFTVAGVDPAMAAPAENWAYLPRSALPPALEAVGTDHSAGVVPVGEWALVGDLAASSIPVDGGGVTVVAPAGMDVDPERKAGFLAAFLSPYTLDPGATDWVTIAVAPDSLPSAGRMYDDTGYVTQHAFWDGQVGSVWIHEFIHARQEFALAPDLRWFTEASATYLTYRAMEEQYDGVTETDVRNRITATADHTHASLANHSAGVRSRVDYERGTRLLYAVDAEIRAGSAGNRTLFDVFRAMNQQEGPISTDEFVRIVERHAGRDVEWIRRAIREGGGLDDRIRRAGAVFEG